MTSKLKQALTLTMFDVGQAECFLLEKGQQSALIDCGTTAQGKNIVNNLRKQGITKIDYLFVTHPHEDHMGGMYDIITNFQIGKIILPNINQIKITTKWYKILINEINSENYQLELAQTGKKYNLEDVEIKVISGISYQGKNVNNYSTVLKITYGQNAIIMTGDAESVIEKEILQTSENINAQILKVGHHGSKTSSTQEFIDAINPTYALISCGLNNRYNHPSEEVIEKLNKQNIEMYRTDELGTVTVTITEKQIEFSFEES